MRRRNMTLATILIFVVLLGVISLSFKNRILLAVSGFLIIQDDLHPVDVIHVIAGEDYRLDYAIQLYNLGYGKKIFLTGGGWCPTHKINHSEVWKKLALEQGVAVEDIIFDDSPITSTYSETVLLKGWIDQSQPPVNSVIVVSDPFHMRRARWTNEHVLGKEVEIVMAPIPFERTPFKQTWWADPMSQNYVKEEYLKIFYYIARYQLSWGLMKDWLASLDRE